MSKNNFFLMREEEIQRIFDPNFTKAQAIKTGVQVVIDFLEKGEENPVRAWAKLCKFKELINSIDAAFRDKMQLSEKTVIDGVSFTPTEGGYTLVYEDDPIYCELKKDVDNRVELLKLAQNQEVIDAYGNTVPKVSKKPRKSSVTISF